MENIKNVDDFLFAIIDEETAKDMLKNCELFYVLHEDGTESLAETETEINTAVKNGLKLAYELTEVKQKPRKQKQATEVKKANEFYTWFQNLGGNLTHFNAENIIKSCSNTVLKFSSFKANPEDTKKRFNHKFTFNL